MQKKSYSIVGLNHTGKEAVVAALKIGHPVMLVREPDNKFDRMAIAVYVDGERVGYIPRTQNRVLADFIDQIGQPWEPPVLAQDAANPAKAIRFEKTVAATFLRSPNSAFPLVEV